MGDIGDFWNDVKAARKAAGLPARHSARPPAEMPTRKEIQAMKAQGFEKKSQWHWQRRLDGGVLDYWPSKAKWQFRGEIKVGKWAELVGLIEQYSGGVAR